LVDIKNVNFTGSNEFEWKGQSYTGALNIYGSSKISVQNSIFRDINADDGLNIKGGISEVTQNIFYRNRDGLDIDFGEGSVSKNYFLDNRDDGIDFGAAGPLKVNNNFIKGSGDKGISVGEGSSAKLLNNIIIKNNVGVAIKDGSDVFFEEDVVFTKPNRIIYLYKIWKF
jgi:hypothetical protein